jgi:hypothetical protein
MERLNDAEVLVDFTEHLSVDESSRLAVTATAADLEYWAHSVAVDGRVGVDDLVDVLRALREHSIPRSSAPPDFPAAAAS